MNSLEEVMLEVYRLDYAEFDVLPKHRFSRAHSKAMEEILNPSYSLMMDYRIEESRVSPKKRILAAVLVVILAAMGIAGGAAAVNTLKRRTDSGVKITNSISSANTTWFEDGMFYEVQNSAGESVLCYYSKSSDRSAVMCGMPECTHISGTSPNCGALADSSTAYRYGFNRVGDKLYYIEAKMSDERSPLGSFGLIESDIDGKNRRVAASIENAYIPFVNGIQYIDGHVLISYYQNFNLEPNEGTGEYEFVNLDKYRFYIQWIDISTGEVETLLYREEYDGRGRGTLSENVLYYSYIYRDVPTSGEMLTVDSAPPLRGGFYVRDLSTGEEKLYEGFLPLGDSFEYFSPYTIMAQSIDDEKIYLFDPETETFNAVADCSGIGYTSDGKDALFAETADSEFWTKYNFETGELSQIHAYKGNLGVFLNGVCAVGDTVWLEVDSENGGGSLQHAYIDRDDFYNGKFENIRRIKEVELK